MRVGINARVLAKPDPAGVGTYTQKLLEGLLKCSESAEFVVFGLESLPTDLNHPRIENASDYPTDHSGLSAHRWEQFHLPLTLRRYDLDLLHTTAGFPPVGASLPLITTIHDISPVTYPEWFSNGYAALYRLLMPLSLRASDTVISISGFTRDEIRRRYPRSGCDIEVIHNGIDQPDASALDPLPTVTNEEFLLTVGSINPRKNIAGLLEGYRRFREQVATPVPIVVAGSYRDVFAAADLPVIDGVHTPGYVPQAQLHWLYDNATAFIYPSLYEGFGLPILEAMAWELPVLTSSRGAMAEVADDAALLVDPEDPSAIGAGMERLVTEPALCDRLRTRGGERVAAFSWERTARETLRVYEKTIENHSSRGR